MSGRTEEVFFFTSVGAQYWVSRFWRCNFGFRRTKSTTSCILGLKKLLITILSKTQHRPSSLAEIVLFQCLRTAKMRYWKYWNNIVSQTWLLITPVFKAKSKPENNRPINILQIISNINWTPEQWKYLTPPNAIQFSWKPLKRNSQLFSSWEYKNHVRSVVCSWCVFKFKTVFWHHKPWPATG